MMDVFMSDFDDPSYDYEGLDAISNIPDRKFDFPFRDQGYAAGVIMSRIFRGELEGKKVDWGLGWQRLTSNKLLICCGSSTRERERTLIRTPFFPSSKITTSTRLLPATKAREVI